MIEIRLLLLCNFKKNMCKYFIIISALLIIDESIPCKIYILMGWFYEQVLTMALISSFSAAYAIGMVGMKGNSYWKPICGSIPKYCDKVTGAFVADLIAVVIYIILLLNSIHTALNPLLLKKKLSNFSGWVCWSIESRVCDRSLAVEPHHPF